MALALALSLALACGARDRSHPAPANVLLIVTDTLGAEHVGYVRPGLDDTPRMDELAREGSAFLRAYAPAPWTQPSVASLLTSRMPSSHGVVRLFDALPDEITTLAERLAAAGYATAGVASHELLAEKYGFSQGFEEYTTAPAGGHRAVTSQRVTDLAIAWLERRPSDRPFFLFAHYFDPHYVYNHHPEFDRTSGYRGPLTPGMNIWKLLGMRASLGPADIAYLVGLYREEVAFADAQAGRLLDALRARGLADDTLVVWAADHGEEFMRHGWIGHTRTLYDELLAVPLVIRAPGIGHREVRAPVSLLDVAPTVLELVGAPPDADAEGLSLRPWMEGAPHPAQRDLHAEVSFAPRPDDPARQAEKSAFATALLRGDLKLVHDLLKGRYALYDRSTDPEEKLDLFASHPEAERLARDLTVWEQARLGGPHAHSVEVGEGERERLRALGYLE